MRRITQCPPEITAAPRARQSVSLQGGLTLIYKATCTATNKGYIGLTTKTLSVRRSQHISAAMRGNNTGCRHFNRAIRKYGRNAFVWAVLARVAPERADRAERELIASHGTMSPHGYNIREGGNSGSHSAETRAKMSKTQTGKTHTAKTRAKLRAANLGRKHTAATCAKISKTMTGRALPLATRAKISQTKRKGK